MRYWTVEEARGYLPRLRELLDTVRRASPATTVRGNGHGEVDPGRAAEAVEAARGALAELEAVGILVRDLAQGLVDFPALGEDGAVHLLCWRSADTDLEWWHPPDEGFAGRRRLPRAPGAGEGL